MSDPVTAVIDLICIVLLIFAWPISCWIARMWRDRR